MSETSKSWIPSMPSEELDELAKRIKAMIRCADKLFYIKPVDIRGMSYIWDPKIDKEATGLKPLCDITTYHTYGYVGFFKPSIAEVIRQIPKKHLKKVVAFEIVDKPGCAADLNREGEARSAGYHVATHRLYMKA